MTEKLPAHRLLSSKYTKHKVQVSSMLCCEDTLMAGQPAIELSLRTSLWFRVWLGSRSRVKTYLFYAMEVYMDSDMQLSVKCSKTTLCSVNMGES